MVFITSLSSWSPPRHWQNMHGMSNAAWAAFPNPLCQNCSNELLITPNAYMAGFCHFIRRQTCREVQRIHSSLNNLYGSDVSSLWNSEIQERKSLVFFSLAVLTVIHPTASLVLQVLQPGQEGHSAAGRAWWLLLPALPGWLSWLMQVTQQKESWTSLQPGKKQRDVRL